MNFFCVNTIINPISIYKGKFVLKPSKNEPVGKPKKIYKIYFNPFLNLIPLKPIMPLKTLFASLKFSALKIPMLRSQN